MQLNIYQLTSVRNRHCHLMHPEYRHRNGQQSYGPTSDISKVLSSNYKDMLHDGKVHFHANSSDTALNIMCSRNVIRQLYREQFSNRLRNQSSPASLHISLYILWYIPGILYSKSFRNIPPSIYRSGSLISYRSKTVYASFPDCPCHA